MIPVWSCDQCNNKRKGQMGTSGMYYQPRLLGGTLNPVPWPWLNPISSGTSDGRLWRYTIFWRSRGYGRHFGIHLQSGYHRRQFSDILNPYSRALGSITLLRQQIKIWAKMILFSSIFSRFWILDTPYIGLNKTLKGILVNK